MHFTITGYSTALFSTWYFIEELGLLFDAGEGMVSTLMQKSRKINHVFISHADRDHLTGLLQFNQLNARPGFPIIHYPKDCGSFPALQEFSTRFDPHVADTIWTPITEGGIIKLREDILVEAIRNGHVEADAGCSKSLSYKVVQVKKKLKPELTHLPGPVIRQIIEEQGTANTHTETRTTLLGYSGDSPVDDIGRWNGTKVLIHEATFLGGPEDAKIQTHGNKHSRLEEVMEMISGIQTDKVILGHFSSRYSHEQIKTTLLQLCEKYGINTPVFTILPGQTVIDILNTSPVNSQ